MATNRWRWPADPRSPDYVPPEKDYDEYLEGYYDALDEEYKEDKHERNEDAY